VAPASSNHSPSKKVRLSRDDRRLPATNKLTGWYRSLQCITSLRPRLFDFRMSFPPSSSGEALLRLYNAWINISFQNPECKWLPWNSPACRQATSKSVRSRNALCPSRGEGARTCGSLISIRRDWIRPSWFKLESPTNLPRQGTVEATACAPHSRAGKANDSGQLTAARGDYGFELGLKRVTWSQTISGNQVREHSLYRWMARLRDGARYDKAPPATGRQPEGTMALNSAWNPLPVPSQFPATRWQKVPIPLDG